MRDKNKQYLIDLGYKELQVFEGEYVLFEHPSIPFGHARLYDDGNLWVKNTNTGEYVREAQV